MHVRPLLEDGHLSDIGSILFDLMDEYYESDKDADHVDVDIIRSRISRKYPKQEDYISHVLDNIEQVSVSNVEKDFVDMRKAGLYQKLGDAFFSGDEALVTELLTEYNQFSNHIATQDDEEIHIDVPLGSLLDMTSPENLIKVYPKALNERLGGGLPRPSHILIYARPETGKSATCINMASGFINKGHRTLYIGNEDNPKVMLLRFICRLSGMPLAEVRADPDTAYAKAKERGYDNLVFAGLAPGSVRDVRKLIEKYEPECVIVDQIHNLEHKNDNKVERLASISKELRDISNEYEVLMVSVTQAGDSAHNKLVLDMGDVDYSNTGIPGNVDAMIGIGMDEAAERGGFRFMTLAKNKPGGGDHGSIKVRLEPALSRVTSA